MMCPTEDKARRMGVIVPAANTIHEREFRRLRPANLFFEFRTFSYPAAGAGFCDALWAGLAEPVGELVEWGAELILIGCTTAAMQCADAVRQSRLEADAGVPIISAAQAAREAIEALKVASLAVATPYGDANNRLVVDYLESIGVKTRSIAGLGLDRSPESWATAAHASSAERLYDAAISLNADDVEALYLPCTGIASLDLIERFERTAGKPALSSVQAGYWAGLRRLGIDGHRNDAGHLVRRWSHP